MSNPQVAPQVRRCPVPAHHEAVLSRRGWCWFGDHFPAVESQATVNAGQLTFEAEAQPQLEMCGGVGC